jgi:quercetin dioxygenase-like cupin family protein
MIGLFQIQGPDAGVDVPWGRLRFLSTPASTGSERLAVVEGVIHAGTGHDFHYHPSQDEVIYVVAGRVEQWLGEEKRVLGPRDAAFIPAGMIHASFAVDGPATLIAMLGPCVGDGLEMIDVASEQPWNRMRGPR